MKKNISILIILATQLLHQSFILESSAASTDHKNDRSMSFELAHAVCGQMTKFGESKSLQPPLKRRPSPGSNLPACTSLDWTDCRTTSNGNCKPFTLKKCEPSGTGKIPSGGSQYGIKMDYDGYKLLTVTLTKSQLNLLKKLESEILIDTWRDAVPIQNLKKNGQKISKILSHQSTLYETDIMISPSDISLAQNFLKSNGLQFKTKIEDIGPIIKKGRKESQKYQAEKRKKQKNEANATAFDFYDYYPTDTIYKWLEEIVAQHSDLASIKVVGKSGRGHDLKMVKISLPNSPPGKPAILMDGGIHAREWISPATVTYGIYDLLTNSSKVNRKLLSKFDLYIIPILNVDGYDYTFTTNRLWRKTLTDLNDTANGCFGVDANRNFDYSFGDLGSSNSKCHPTYHGPYPFSEPETAALRDLMLDKRINWKAYITVHSFGKLWITPWGFTFILPKDHEAMIAAGVVGANALEAVHGTEYLVGPAPYASGCSDDYAKAVAGIKYVVTLELRDNQFQFLLPPEQIVPSGEETWAGIKAFARHVSKKINPFE